MRSSAEASTSPSGSRKPLPLKPAVLAFGILAALGLSWQLLHPKQETVADRADPSPEGISVSASKPVAEAPASAAAPAAEPQPPSSVKHDIPGKIPEQDRTPSASERPQRQDHKAADNPPPTLRPSAGDKPVALTAKPVTQIECPKCDCTDLLTKLSMGTEPISPIQMAYLRQNCRQ